jgi:LmbE family N-acetylglucosaminyl deacetylase
MIVPLVEDAVWRARLGELPLWKPMLTPTMVLSPHPDDETLGCGGLIASLRESGVPVTVVAVTDGERAYADAQGLAEVRHGEQARALQRLGVRHAEVVRLGLPDTAVTQHGDELVARLLPLVARDTHILAPWTGDFHPDHEACGRAAEELARKTGAALTFYFFWTWHRGTPASVQGQSLVRLELSPGQLRAKCEALRCHRSQLEREEEEPILPERLLGPVSWPFEVYLPS